MYPYVLADVFTSTPLEGNPVAVLTDARGLPPPRMQQIAREFNLSETVFVLPAEQGADARVRIFTPAAELPFAGHPVLGTAFVLGMVAGGPTIRLETGAGVIRIDLTRENGRIGSGQMQQPIPEWEPYDRAGELLAALGVPSSELPVETYRNGPQHVYVTLASEQEVAALQPDLGVLARTPGFGVACCAGAGRRWKVRNFAPGLGVPEDPATGSAAGPLAVHLTRYGRIASGQEIEISQGAEIGRPSTLYARATGAGNRIDAVEVGGSVVVIAHGQLDA
ncbi:MAG TPA: PhzF family phenazine biosynthesis protein [Streptosporangiaceae bacterium]|nr:PhzF family phenazine biosynthesis protein [Streptosporangiaceae bacterium]